jgi:uncharacterized membrane protein YfcA
MASSHIRLLYRHTRVHGRRGSGVFIVPILTFFYAFKVSNATGTSLTAIIFTAMASTLNYRKQKRIYYKTGLVLAVTSAQEHT